MSRLDREEHGVSEVEEAVMAHGVATSNALTALIGCLVQKSIITKADLETISKAFSKPLDLDGPRENALVRNSQDQFDGLMAALVALIEAKGL